MTRRARSLEETAAEGFDLTSRPHDEICDCGHRWGDHLASWLDPPPDACGFIDCPEAGCGCEASWSFGGVPAPMRCAYGRQVLDETDSGRCGNRGTTRWDIVDDVDGGDTLHLAMCEAHTELLDLLEHMVDRQIRPQQLVAQLQADGIDGVEIGVAYTGGDDLGEEWITMECHACGRTAQIPWADIPENMRDQGTLVTLCPACM